MVLVHVAVALGVTVDVGVMVQDRTTSVGVGEIDGDAVKLAVADKVADLVAEAV